MEENKKVLIVVGGTIGIALALAIGLAVAMPVEKVVEIIDVEVEQI